jgi:hypothetical protein
MGNVDYSATGGFSRAELLRQSGLAGRVLPRPRNIDGILDGISAVRSIFPKLHFDEENCKRGLECLRNYSRRWDDTRKVYSSAPLHDQYSNGADALRTFAVGYGLSHSEERIEYVHRPQFEMRGFTGATWPL